MNIKMNKKIAVFLAIMIFALSFTTTGFAKSAVENLKAYYRNIVVFRNGTQVGFTHEPFIVDGTTYVPVRDMSEMLDKIVGWNNDTNRIDITDKPDSNLAAMMTQIVEQQMKINELESLVKKLESEIAKVPTIKSLSDLEKQLNRDFGTFEKVNFKINLYESKGKIEARIYINTRRDFSGWNSITTSNLKSFVQDIVDDIKYEYKDIDVSGFINDDETGKDVITFNIYKNGTVNLSNKGSSGSSSNELWDLEKYLNNYYSNYADVDVDFKYQLNEGYDYIDATISVDDYYWTKISPRTYLNEIGNEITRYFPGYQVRFNVESTNYPYNALYTFTYN